MRNSTWGTVVLVIAHCAMSACHADDSREKGHKPVRPLAVDTKDADERQNTDANTLTDDEKRAGFELLFNGHDLRGWEPEFGEGKLEDSPWKVQDGAICFSGDESSCSPPLAYTAKAIPEDFELRFQWKEAPPGSSMLQGHFGLATFGATTENGWKGRLQCNYLAGERFIQLVTDEISVPIKFAGESRSTMPNNDARRPAGQWNEARMLCKGPLVQHWLNGEKILEVDLREGNWLRLTHASGNPLLDCWLKERKRGLCLEISNIGSVAAWYRGFKVRPLGKDEKLDQGPASQAQR